MTNITDIIADNISIERELVLSKINGLVNADIIPTLAENIHTHMVGEVRDVSQVLTQIADIGHNHDIAEFPVFEKISKNFAILRHSHNKDTMPLIYYEIELLQQKINLLQQELINSISIVEQLLKTK